MWAWAEVAKRSMICEGRLGLGLDVCINMTWCSACAGVRIWCVGSGEFVTLTMRAESCIASICTHAPGIKMLPRC